MSNIKILHLEDSPLDVELIRNRLVKEGLVTTLVRAVGHDDYLEALESSRFDLILADYSLPGFDGLEALRVARATVPDTPFLFVSGVLGEEVAIETLRQGATDYVLKHRLDRLGPAVRRALTESRERAERRKAEAALRESERMHRLTLDSVKDYAILTMDTEGWIASSNSAVNLLLGYREADLIGQASRILFTPEDDRDGIPRRELLRAGTRGSGDDERWYVRKDGSRFWGSGLVTPLLDEHGQIRGFTKVIRDMTERKRVDEALKLADRRKDEFLAMLAHELRNPLSTINNAALLAQLPDLPPERLEWTKQVITNQVRHLSRLVDDLLDVSRFTRGKIRLRPEAVDLTIILERAIEATHDMIDARKHELGLLIESRPLWVDADATRMEQIFVNLLTNAAKYTEQGGKIGVQVYRDRAEMIVKVRDNGVGIGPEMLPNVFDLFAQVDDSLDRTQGGLGIGLTIVKRLVELHGGSIEALSEGIGHGSEFIVRIPAGSVPAQPQPVTRPVRPASQPGARVLVVDDNQATAIALGDLLQMSGYDVHLVHDGPQAIIEARLHQPKVVLLDIGLPGMNGYQVAENLRREEGLSDATIIAITGYSEDQARKRSREAGFDHHLVKPVDYEALLDLLACESGQKSEI